MEKQWSQGRLIAEYWVLQQNLERSETKAASLEEEICFLKESAQGEHIKSKEQLSSVRGELRTARQNLNKIRQAAEKRQSKLENENASLRKRLSLHGEQGASGNMSFSGEKKISIGSAHPTQQEKVRTHAHEISIQAWEEIFCNDAQPDFAPLAFLETETN